MEPLIRDADWVSVRCHDPIRVGSVVLAVGDSGELVCHRVLRFDGEMILLAGDRSLTACEQARDSVLGVVRSVERGGVELRLGGSWRCALDRLEASLHRLSLRHRGRSASRALEALRRVLLEARGYVGLAAAVVRRAASSASKAGASLRRRPASSR